MGINQRLQYTKGDVIVLTIGEYDSYDIKASVRVLVDFNAEQALRNWGDQHADSKTTTFAVEGGVKKHYYAHPDGVKFEDWLVSEGLVERLPYRELNIGSQCGPVHLTGSPSS